MRLFELLNSAEVIGVNKMVCVLQLFTAGKFELVIFSFKDHVSEPELKIKN